MALRSQGRLLLFVAVGWLLGIGAMLTVGAWFGVSALSQIGCAAVTAVILYRGACATAIANQEHTKQSL